MVKEYYTIPKQALPQKNKIKIGNAKKLKSLPTFDYFANKVYNKSKVFESTSPEGITLQTARSRAKHSTKENSQ